MLTKYSIGIDISKKDFHVCFCSIDDEQQLKITGSKRFLNTLSGYKSFQEWYEKRSKEPIKRLFVLEATGVYQEGLAWFLYDQDESVSIVLAQRSKAFMKSIGIKSKNDSVDAQGLAKMGAIQALKEWKPLSKKIYDLRSVTRHIEDLQNMRTALLNQKESFKHQKVVSPVIFKSIEKTLTTLENEIDLLKKEVRKLIETDEILAERVGYMTSIKGVGVLTAAIVIAETNGFALVRNLKQIVSYAGYDVQENQSGLRVGKTKITKKGNAHIRRAMHLPAFGVVRHQESTFKNLYERVYEKSGSKMKAYVAVQSKLLRMLYTLWKKEENFDCQYQKITSGEQKNKSLCSVSS